MLIVPRKRLHTSQPQSLINIDLSTAIGRAVDSVFYPHLQQVNPANPAYPWSDVYGWGQSWQQRANPNGRAVYNSSSLAYRLTQELRVTGNEGNTILVVVRPLSACTSVIIDNVADGWNAASIRMVEASGQRFQLLYNGASTLDDPDTYEFGKTYTIITSSAASGNSLWVNGVEKASNSTTLIALGYMRRLSIYSPSSTAGAVELSLVIRFNRLLSDVEKKSVSDNPWQIFRAPDSRIFVPTGGASTATYTIYPTGSLVFNNNTPSIKTNILPTSGNITYSGTNNIIFSNGATTYTITPSGSISYINSSILKRDRVLYTSGNITYSGSVITQHTKLLSISGLITYTGSVNNIKIKIVNPTGKISYTGTNPIYVPGSGVVTTRLPLTGAGN